MKLIEISEQLVPVWRAFGIPMTKALSITNISQAYNKTTSDTQKTRGTRGYSGEWVSIDRRYSHGYGKDIGGVDELSVPLLATFLVPRSVADADPVQHTDDDHDIPNVTKRLPFGMLNHMINLEMYICGSDWEPFNQQKLQQLMDDPDRLEYFISRTQEY